MIELSGKPGVGSFSSLFKHLQQWTNSFASPTNYGGGQAPTTHKINKTKGNSENPFFLVIFRFKELKVKQCKSN
jgi:hypothetical protein